MSGNFEPSSAINERSTATSRFSIPKRYVQAFLASLALFIIHWRRSSFLDILTHIFVSTYRTEQEYNWKPEDAEWMNAAFSWGCIVAQIPGALLTIKFGSHRILFASMLVTTVFNIIVPMTFSKHVPVVIIIRILQGISEGPIYPACVGIWKSWAPPSERSTLFSIVLCGSYFGSVVGLPANRALAENFGETACFLISSIFGLIWCLVWMTQTYESPSSHPHISHSELAYLEENVDADNRLEVTVKSVPWLSILKSLPVWLISLANFCYACSTFVLIILPFMDNRIEVEFAKGKVIKENKSEKTATSIVQQKILDQVLPNIIIGVVVSLSGFFADFLINRAYLSRSTVRKLYCSGGFTLHGIAFLIIRYYYNTDSTVICMNLAHGFLGLSAVGFLVNCFDLSPCCASIVMAICQVFGNLGSEITNLILYKISNHWTSSDVYDTVISASFVIAFMYACFGSGNMQWWGKPEATRAVAVEDESARSTYYSYPDGADRVDLIVDGCELQPSTASTELGN